MGKKKRVDRYYRGQGRCYLAPFGEEEFLFLGNVAKLVISLEVETKHHKESVTGHGIRDSTVEVVSKASVALTGDNFIKETIALALFGTAQFLSGTTVSGETHIAPEVGESFYVDNVDLSSLSIAGFTEGQDYSVDLKFGRVRILQGSAIAPEDELEVNYTFNDMEVVDAFNQFNSDHYLKFEGFNNAEFESILIEIYRMRFRPLAEWKLISGDFSLSELEGVAQVDRSRKAQGQGQVFAIRRSAEGLPTLGFCENISPSPYITRVLGVNELADCNNSEPSTYINSLLGANELAYCNSSEPSPYINNLLGANELAYCNSSEPSPYISAT